GPAPIRPGARRFRRPLRRKGGLRKGRGRGAAGVGPRLESAAVAVLDRRSRPPPIPPPAAKRGGLVRLRTARPLPGRGAAVEDACLFPRRRPGGLPVSEAGSLRVGQCGGGSYGPACLRLESRGYPRERDRWRHRTFGGPVPLAGRLAPGT